MNDRLKASLKQLERLLQIRQTSVSIAETAVKTAEREVHNLEAAETEITGNIQHTQAAIAYLQTATGHDLRNNEQYIQALKIRRTVIRQSLEKAIGNLEQRRREWTEAMREQKIIEKLQERRLHQWEREQDVATQKSQDDVSVGSYVRSRQKH